MSLIYFLIFNPPLPKQGFYDHVLCMQAHRLNTFLSLLGNLYQMYCRHLCPGSLKNSKFSNTRERRQAPRQKTFRYESPVEERLRCTIRQWSSQERKRRERTCKSTASSAHSPWHWQWRIRSASAQGMTGNPTRHFHVAPANALASFHPSVKIFLYSYVLEHSCF